MNASRPGVLAVRAANQYRRRDVLSYLGLRYYAENSAAHTDNWAKDVATNLVLNRDAAPYFLASHFKEITSNGVTHREITLPGPNEALAETALLDECSRYPNAFDPAPCVFSYRLATGDDRSGLYEHYVNGLRKRHLAIAEACDNTPSGVVLYTDIKRFYPSIRPELALKAWSQQCEIAGMSSAHKALGEKLIHDHAAATDPSSPSILTGPMFSHLIGNLVLRDIDEALSASLPAKYFRYVDDITLVGSEEAVYRSREIVRERLEELGLFLHDESSPKNLEVPVSEWLEGRNDFAESSNPISWMTLIADLKRFLFKHPDQREALQTAFVEKGFRIPTQDYSGAVGERGYLARLRQLLSKKWFRERFRKITINSLVYQAEWLRESYRKLFDELLADDNNASGYARKRLIPKQRYMAGRLIYLLNQEELGQLYPRVQEHEELFFHASVMEAISTGSVDRILELGTNAAQAAAQPLRAGNIDCTTDLIELTKPQTQALAILLLNGINVARTKEFDYPEKGILKFSEIGSDSDLMQDADHFVRELACLHGISEEARHSEILDSAFDADEELALDAIDQFHQSLSA
ncbi:MAG: RNA-directed DNA polymerase [Candidatus Sedimenticola sp. 6PFRAG7]